MVGWAARWNPEGRGLRRAGYGYAPSVFLVPGGTHEQVLLTFAEGSKFGPSAKD